MNKLTALYIICLCVFYCTACQKAKFSAPQNLGLAYYPLQLGSRTIYAVDSTVYSDFNNSITTYHFQIKDSVAQVTTNNEGHNQYRIERYKKSNTVWEYQKTIARTIVANRAEEFIDNRRYVRLVFPQTLNSSWNGNLYNDLEEWRHRIINLDEAIEINGLKIDSSLLVEQYNENNLIREDSYYETYAKHIGLVEKNVKAVDKDINTGAIKRGYTYKMSILSHR